MDDTVLMDDTAHAPVEELMVRAIRYSRPLAHPQTQLQAVDDVRESRERVALTLVNN